MNIGGNVYVNHFVGGVLDVGSSVLVIVMLKRFKRKTSLIALLFVFSAFSLLTPLTREGKVTLFVENDDPSNDCDNVIV